MNYKSKLITFPIFVVLFAVLTLAAAEYDSVAIVAFSSFIIWVLLSVTKNKSQNKFDNIFPIIYLLVVCSPFYYYMYQRHKLKAIENDVYLWTHGSIYCGVCKRQEKITYVHVGEEFSFNECGRKITTRKITIATDEHRDKKSGRYDSFEASATTEGFHIRDMKIGIHPGCNYDCTGCDRYGWDE